MKVLLLFLTCACTFGEMFASNTPINPSDYQAVAGTGFATNYFKTLAFQKYNKQNLVDVRAKGFKNLRLRCRADLEGLNMTVFLNNLNTVVDDCLSEDVTPIISWIHHEAEAFANETHKQDYLDWWEEVAKKLKDKDYRLSFNLFTELGVDECNKLGISCENSLRENTTKYNEWTREVVDKIRNSGGKNNERIIILGSPKKTGKGLDEIAEDIYENDEYMMAEWHIYASGPNKKIKNDRPWAKYWEGNGELAGKDNVDEAIKYATDFTSSTNISTYLGAWMPQDNESGALNQTEVINFARYFVAQFTIIPWSLNVLDRYYDTRSSFWLTDMQTVQEQSLNFSTVLENIIEVM